MRWVLGAVPLWSLSKVRETWNDFSCFSGSYRSSLHCGVWRWRRVCSHMTVTWSQNYYYYCMSHNHHVPDHGHMMVFFHAGLLVGFVEWNPSPPNPSPPWIHWGPLDVQPAITLSGTASRRDPPSLLRTSPPSCLLSMRTGIQVSVFPPAPGVTIPSLGEVSSCYCLYYCCYYCYYCYCCNDVVMMMSLL